MMSQQSLLRRYASIKQLTQGYAPRPQMTKEKRTRRFEIRLTEDEYQKIKQLKTRHHAARWLRELALSQAPAAGPISQQISADPAMIRIFSSISNNLNQIARKVNSADLDPVTAMNILISLREIQSAALAAKGDLNDS